MNGAEESHGEAWSDEQPLRIKPASRRHLRLKSTTPSQQVSGPPVGPSRGLAPDLLLALTDNKPPKEASFLALANVAFT